MSASSETWWSRPCGGREVFVLAAPLVLSMASQAVMLFVDRMYLMWYSAEAAAAATPAGMLYWTVVSFPIGVTQYVTAFVAQYYGAKRPERIGAVLWQSVWFGIATIPLFLLSIPLAGWLFTAAGHTEPLLHNERVFYEILVLGGGPAVMSAAVSSYFIGRGASRPVMIVDITAAIANIVLDYLWIFGKFGFPEWGIAGAAAATAISQGLKLVLLAGVVWIDPERPLFHLWEGLRWDGPLFGRLLYFGSPSGLQFVIEGSAFTFFMLLMGALGVDAMAATTLAINVNFVAFIPMVGVATAATTLVGQQIGEGRPDLAERATYTALAMAVLYSGSFALLYLLAPDLFLAAFGAQGDRARYLELYPTVVVLLRFVAAFCVFDAMQLVFSSAIKGAGDTLFILVTTVWVSALGIVAGAWGLQAGGGLYFCWSVITGWICLLGVIYAWRFWQGKWRTMRVIETPLVGPADDESLAFDDSQPIEGVSGEVVLESATRKIGRSEGQPDSEPGAILP